VPTFNVLYVGRGKYLSSIVNPIAEKQNYMMSELSLIPTNIYSPVK